jgi:ribokinase
VIDVCVVGSFMMDLVVRAPRRPGPGETLVGESFEMFLGGKGFNQAVAAARSGATTAMVGTLGDDDFAARFRTALSEEQIDVLGVRTDPDHGTGVATPLVEDSGDNSIVIVPRANHALRPDAVSVPEAKVVLLQLELPLDTVCEAARQAKAQRSVVILNPAPAVTTDLDSFAGVVDYVVPNETEAAHLAGTGDLDAAAGRLLRATGAHAVIVTLGPNGVLVVPEQGSAERRTAYPVTPVDTVGAGDAFCGAMAAALARGESLSSAVQFGNAAGALAVTRRGAEPSMPRMAEIADLVAGSAGANRP